jgi:hypothetical protein
VAGKIWKTTIIVKLIENAVDFQCILVVGDVEGIHICERLWRRWRSVILFQYIDDASFAQQEF